MEKQIHIVFQVLNFLSKEDSIPFDLTADEKLLLIFLVKHKGVKGIYPAVATLARELKRTPRTIQRTLLRLKAKKLILIESSPGKSNQYLVLLPQPTLSTTPRVDATPHLSTPLASTPPHPSRGREATPRVDATQIERVNNIINKTERERKKRAHPLPQDFLPNQETIDFARDIGLSGVEAQQEFEKFVLDVQAKGYTRVDWQKALQKWLLDAANHKKNAKPKNPEPRSTVPYYRPENEDRRGSQAIGQLLTGLMEKDESHMNGGSTNGLGSSKKGEGKGD